MGGTYPGATCRSIHYHAREYGQKQARFLITVQKGETSNTWMESTDPSLVSRPVIHLLRIWSQCPLVYRSCLRNPPKPGPPALSPRVPIDKSSMFSNGSISSVRLCIMTVPRPIESTVSTHLHQGFLLYPRYVSLENFLASSTTFHLIPWYWLLTTEP